MDHPGILDVDPEAPSAAIVWNQWRHKFENFTRAARLNDDEKLRLLVNYVSPNIYEHIRCCVTYEDAVTSLTTCFSKPDNKITAQFRLFSRKQKSDESAESYAEALRVLSRDCRSGCDPCREDAILGLFVAGLSSPRVRLKLLEHSSLTLTEAVACAKTLELPPADTEHSDNDDAELNGDCGLDGSFSDGSTDDPVVSEASRKNPISTQNLPINALIKIVKTTPSEKDESSPKTTESIRKRPKVEYLCYYCNAKYSNKLNLTKHMHNHVDGLPIYACEWCDYKAKATSELNRHITRHTGERRYACGTCDYRARLKRHLTQHLRVHTGEKPYACVLCGFRASQKFSLVKHVRRHHIGEKTYACGECDFRAFTSDEVNVHKRTHTGEKPYACSSCDYKCATRTSLRKHVLRHEPNSARIIPSEEREKNFACDQCEFKTHDKHYLSKHKDKRHKGDSEKKLTCDVCGYKAAFNYMMKNHMRTHNGVRPFQCNLCSYSSITKNQLKSHMAKHTGGGKFACESCPYSTPVKMRLVRHLRTHTGEKPYACDACGYRAALKENLTAHKKTHTGEKRYSCDRCSYGTNKKSQLSEHAKTHQGQVQGQPAVNPKDIECTNNQVFVAEEVHQTPSTWPTSRPSTAIPNLWSPGKFH